MPAPLRVFVGFDPRQIVAYSALGASLLRTCSRPLAITPLVLEALPVTRAGLTPFTFSRFLVPHLCDYQGWALFLDGDTMARADLAELFALADDSCDVMVVKNRLAFEWPSVMLFNNARCRVLTPDYVQSAPNPLTLDWAHRIGALPTQWNHLVGYDAPRGDAKLVHFTQGVPAHPETEDCEYSREWAWCARMAMSTQPWEALMGASVHADPVRERLKGDAAQGNVA